MPPPPPAAPQKSGAGCFSWGCTAVLVFLLLIVGALFTLSYFSFSKITHLTSTAPTTPAAFDGGDGVYQKAMQKTDDFSQTIQQNKPTSLELSADEINTLIARDPDFAKYQIRTFVSMTGDHADVQISLPTNLIPYGLIKDRFLNVEADVTPAFDPATKSINFTLHSFKFAGGTVPPEELPKVQDNLNPLINTQIQNSPDAKQVLDRAKDIEIRNGKLIIQME